MRLLKVTLALLLLLTACRRNSNDLRQGALASISTADATAFKNTAFSGGTISTDGGDSITQRGICWDTLPNPTQAGNHTSDGRGTGTFSSSLTALRPATTYYLRAYASNSSGTAYGNEISVKTLYYDLYFGGCINPAARPVATYWTNGVPTYLTNGSQNAYVQALFVSGTDVYAGGIESNGLNWVAKIWKNGTLLTTLTDGTTNAEIHSIQVVGTDVYACGTDYDNACYWKNGVRTTLPGGTATLSIAVSGPDVYVCGNYYGGYTNPVSYAMIWKNGVKTELTNRSTLSNANAVCLSGSDVYVGGREHATAKIWKNGVAQNLPGSSFFSIVYALCLNGGNVYAGGRDMPSSSGNSFPIYWKNGVNQPLNNASIGGEVKSIYALGNDVYVCGHDSGEIFVAGNGTRMVYPTEPNTVDIIYLH